MSLILHVRRALRALGIPAREQRLLVAVSGGADSVALVCGLAVLAPSLGLSLKVAHLHHGLRGADADADARFVRALARRLRVPCVVGHARVKARARRRGISIEMAAREARYAFLVREAGRWRGRGAVAVATAHTADDQAETVLLRLIRGTGTRGLGGIPAERMEGGVRVVRPLLGVRRGAVERYLRGKRQAWRDDASNNDRAMQRNRVRQDVLPFLAATLNPRVHDALLRTASLARDEEAWLSELTAAILPTVQAEAGSLDVAGLARLPRAARWRVLRAWLAARGADSQAQDFATQDFATVERIDALARRGRGAVALSGGWQAVRQGARLELRRVVAARAFAAEVRIPGITNLPEAGLAVDVRAGSVVVRERGAGPGALPARASLAWDKLRGRRLVVRSWRPGDRMAPYGLAGHQKLQDIFVNARVPRDARGRVPVFTCGREIIWIPGYRIARDWAVRDGVRILELAARRI